MLEEVSRFNHSITFATVKADEIMGSQPAGLLNLGTCIQLNGSDSSPGTVWEEVYEKMNLGSLGKSYKTCIAEKELTTMHIERMDLHYFKFREVVLIICKLFKLNQ